MPASNSTRSAICYRFGDFTLRTRPLGLFRGRDRLALPVQPLSLLSLLLDRAGELVTQDQIREAVWPGRTVDFTGSTHVAIRQIRAALGDDTTNPAFVETVPRRGYRFVADVRVDRARSFVPAAAAAAAILAVIAATASQPFWSPGDSRPLPRAHAAAENVRLGEYLLGRAGSDSAGRSLAYFETALADAPENARALHGAARAALAVADFERAEAYVRRALDADPLDAGAHDAAGGLSMIRDWDWDTARASFERALDLDPRRASAHHGLAALDALARDFDSALSHMETARQLDPASTLIQADYGWFLYYAGRHGEAAEACERALALEPEAVSFLFCIIRARTEHGEVLAALDPIAALMERSGATAAEADGILSLPPREAVSAFERWRLFRYLAPDRTEPVPRLTLAMSYALTGDRDAAITLLEEAVNTHDGPAPFALIDPVFASLREEPRFRELEQRVLPAT